MVVRSCRRRASDRRRARQPSVPPALRAPVSGHGTRVVSASAATISSRAGRAAAVQSNRGWSGRRRWRAAALPALRSPRVVRARLRSSRSKFLILWGKKLGCRTKSRKRYHSSVGKIRRTPRAGCGARVSGNALQRKPDGPSGSAMRGRDRAAALSNPARRAKAPASDRGISFPGETTMRSMKLESRGIAIPAPIQAPVPRDANGLTGDRKSGTAAVTNSNEGNVESPASSAAPVAGSGDVNAKRAADLAGTGGSESPARCACAATRRGHRRRRPAGKS